MSVLKPINPDALFSSSKLGFSQGILDESSGLVFFSGQVGVDKSFSLVGDDLASQARKAFENLAIALDESGAAKESIVYLRINLRGECEDHLPALTPILGEFLGAAQPATTIVGVSSLFTKAALIEVEAVARPG